MRKTAARSQALHLAAFQVALSRYTGQTDIAIPVEVILNNGTAQVQINLRLTLNLKLQG